MTNRSSFEVEKMGTLATLPWPLGLLTFSKALATLWTPTIHIWSLYEKGKKLEERCEKNGRWVQKETFFCTLSWPPKLSYILFSY